MTTNQHKLLSFVWNYQQTNGSPPTLQEMVKAVGVVDNSSLMGVIRNLTAQGYLASNGQKTRHLIVTGKALVEQLVIFPQRYEQPEQRSSQPTDFAKGSVGIPAISNTGRPFAGQPTGIKADGTNFTYDIRTVVESAIGEAISSYFGSGSVYTGDNTGRPKRASAMTMIFSRVFSDPGFKELAGWLVLFVALTWANTKLVGPNSTALLFIVIEAGAIRILGNKL
jgi:hypothetical protein